MSFVSSKTMIILSWFGYTRSVCVLFWAFLLMLFAGGTAWAVVPTEEKPIAILRALDKITARVEEFEVSKNAPYHFGALSLVLRSCRETTPEETPEAAAFLQVVEKTIDDEVRPVFSGWMFASSPALSAMEHPVYDIWLMGCRDQKME